jgi:hypothetical protein
LIRQINADEARRLLGLGTPADLALVISAQSLPAKLIVLWTGARLMVRPSQASLEYTLEGDDPDGSDVEKVMPFLNIGSQFHQGAPVYVDRGQYVNPALGPIVCEGEKRGVSHWWGYLDQLFDEAITREWPTISREDYFALIRDLWSHYRILPLFESGGPPHFPPDALTTPDFVQVVRGELTKRYGAVNSPEVASGPQT